MPGFKVFFGPLPFMNLVCKNVKIIYAIFTVLFTGLLYLRVKIKLCKTIKFPIPAKALTICTCCPEKFCLQVELLNYNS